MKKNKTGICPDLQFFLNKVRAGPCSASILNVCISDVSLPFISQDFEVLFLFKVTTSVCILLLF